MIQSKKKNNLNLNEYNAIKGQLLPIYYQLPFTSKTKNNTHRSIY